MLPWCACTTSSDPHQTPKWATGRMCPVPKCGKCGAAIKFFPTLATGKPMPVDAEPNANGNLVIVEVNGVKKVGPAPSADPSDDGVASSPDDNPYRAPRFTSHF